MHYKAELECVLHSIDQCSGRKLQWLLVQAQCFDQQLLVVDKLRDKAVRHEHTVNSQLE